MIPNQIEDWLAGGPWQTKEENFWKHVLNQTLEPFTLYTIGYGDGRASHEIAHLVELKDLQHLYSPNWGCNEFTAKGVDPEGFMIHGKLSVESSLREIEVGMIESTINYHIGKISLFDTENGMLHTANTFYSAPDGLSGRDAENYFKQMFKQYPHWRSIENVWNELQRKYQIIREMKT